MGAREATSEDIGEVIRLAGQMYASMGDPPAPEWFELAAADFGSRLGAEVTAFVVDHPGGRGRLVASGCGIIQHRLVSPRNSLGFVGHIQWVCTDPEARRQGHGTAVMQGLIGWFESRSVPSIELHATTDGEPVYRALGFSDRGPVALRRRSGDMPA